MLNLTPQKTILWVEISSACLSGPIMIESRWISGSRCQKTLNQFTGSGSGLQL